MMNFDFQKENHHYAIDIITGLESYVTKFIVVKLLNLNFYTILESGKLYLEAHFVLL